MGKRFIKLVPLLGVLTGVAIIFLRNPLLRILPIETEGARQMTSTLLLIYSLWIGVRNISYVCVVGIFRAGGDTKIGMFLDIGALFLFSIPIVTTLGLFDRRSVLCADNCDVYRGGHAEILTLPDKIQEPKMDKAADRRGLRAAGSRRGPEIEIEEADELKNYRQ